MDKQKYRLTFAIEFEDIDDIQARFYANKAVKEFEDGVDVSNYFSGFKMPIEVNRICKLQKIHKNGPPSHLEL